MLPAEACRSSGRLLRLYSGSFKAIKALSLLMLKAITANDSRRAWRSIGKTRSLIKALLLLRLYYS
jgi:hypothetical protein